MGHAEAQPRRYTVEEYFALEKASDVRHEFFEGEIFAMAGESIPHNKLVGNAYLALRQALDDKPCQVLFETIQVAVEHSRHYTYPDVVVSCDPRDQEETRRQQHPILIIEVLSPSTEAYDRTLKFSQYKKLPSLRHYLLVSQKGWFVDWFQLTEHGVWGHTGLAEANDLIAIPELGLTLTLAQLYRKTGVAPLRVLPPTAAEPDGSKDEE